MDPNDKPTPDSAGPQPTQAGSVPPKAAAEPTPAVKPTSFGAPPDGSYAVEENKDARQWAMFAHLASLVGYIGVPFGNIVGPLVVWQIKKQEYPFVDMHGKESVNFQISWTLWMIAAGLSILCVVGIVLLPVAAILDIVFMIIAALKANNGEPYRYPLTIRFIK